MNFLDTDNALTIVRGATRTWRLSVTGATGGPVDLTAGRLVMSLKRAPEDVTPLFVKDSTAPGGGGFTIANPRTGEADLTLQPADTHSLDPGVYLFDLWLIQGGSRHPIIPLSTLTITEAITRVPLP